jgi:hypothetical protein
MSVRTAERLHDLCTAGCLLCYADLMIRESAVALRPRIEKLLGQVHGLKTDVHKLADSYRDACTTSNGVGQDLKLSEDPIRTAQSDTDQIDVSVQGRAAQQHLNRADRGVNTNDIRLHKAADSAKLATSSFSSAQVELQALVDESKDFPECKSKLTLANASLETSANEHDNAVSESNWGLTALSGVDRGISWAGMSAMNISNDRPGRNVSGDARQAATQIDQAEWNLQDSGNRLSCARLAESSAELELSKVETALAQALASLPSLPQEP